MDDATLKALHEATGKATSSSTSLRILEACVLAGLVDSNAEAKKAIASGAIFLNEQPVQEISYQLSPTDFLGGKLALLRKGKKQYATILLT